MLRTDMRLKRQSWIALVTILILVISTFGQTPSTPAQKDAPAKEVEDSVVRVTTNLVQVDVVVTDKSGKQVTDLRPEDFEILEDGHPQKITHFSYVSSSPTSSQPVASYRPAKKGETPLPIPPSSQLRPEQVHRTIALVVDDLGLSFESVAFARDALKKFVD